MIIDFKSIVEEFNNIFILMVDNFLEFCMNIVESFINDLECWLKLFVVLRKFDDEFFIIFLIIIEFIIKYVKFFFDNVVIGFDNVLIYVIK